MAVARRTKKCFKTLLKGQSSIVNNHQANTFNPINPWSNVSNRFYIHLGFLPDSKCENGAG